MIKLLPGNTYHIVSHSVGGENIFRSDQNYSYFLKLYTKHINCFTDTYAYTLLPNHFHILLRIHSENEINRMLNMNEEIISIENVPNWISKQFSNFFNAYAKAFNKMYNRKGTLFNRPFKRKMVESEQYFRNILIYIHNNPVKHGLAHKYTDWQYSSVHSYITSKRSAISKERPLKLFGSIEELKSLHDDLTLINVSDNFLDIY